MSNLQQAHEPAANRDEVISVGEMVDASFRRHAAAIRGKALQLTRDPEVAADVTQEAFLRLFVEAQAGRTPDNIGAWLYRTSANLVVSRARRASVAQRFAPRLVRYDGPAEPDAIVVLGETHDELHAVLATLPEADRVALLMAAEGATGPEIARRIGRSEVATRTMLCRARRRLRTTVELGSLAMASASTPAPGVPVARSRHPYPTRDRAMSSTVPA